MSASVSVTPPSVGVWLIGARGSVATTVVAGCAAVVERLVAEKIAELDGDILPFAGNAQPTPGRAKSDQVVSLEQELRRMLGTKIEIRRSARGRGRIVVHFSSADEFERLFDVLSGGRPPTADVKSA